MREEARLSHFYLERHRPGLLQSLQSLVSPIFISFMIHLMSMLLNKGSSAIFRLRHGSRTRIPCSSFVSPWTTL